MQRLKISFMELFYYLIMLKRYNASKKQLQYVKIQNDKVSQIYASLINLVQKTRDNFKKYEIKSKTISEITKYNVITARH